MFGKEEDDVIKGAGFFMEEKTGLFCFSKHYSLNC